jgi:Na+/H+ antiporter NhaD/arsenite permease-like protein
LVVALVLIFIAIYAAIALEHPLEISKSASALFGAGLLWTIYGLSIGDQGRLGHELDETVTTTARITFFLLGAMTIVEVIDAHDGFVLITSRIRTRQLTGLAAGRRHGRAASESARPSQWWWSDCREWRGSCPA